MLYDRNDKVPRLDWLAEFGVNARLEKMARAVGRPWPPYVQIGSRIFYSRQRTLEWLAQQERRSPGEAAVEEDEEPRAEAQTALLGGGM